MSHRQKKALEIAIRDAMDGMEQLASMMAYRRLPEEMEILGIGDESEAEQTAAAAARLVSAEIIRLDRFRDAARRHPPQADASQENAPSGKNNKIRML
jgi:hypothetical protein